MSPVSRLNSAIRQLLGAVADIPVRRFGGRGASSGGRCAWRVSRLVTVLVLCAGAWLALAVGSASAATGFKYLGQLTGTPSGPLGALYPVAVNPANGNVYVADRSNLVVDVFSSSGVYLSQFGPPSSTPAGSFNPIGGLAVDPGTGNVYVGDSGNGVVDVFSPSGTYLSQLAAPSTATPAGPFDPLGVAVDPATGDVYVADVVNGVVDVFSSAGAYLSQITGGATPAGSGSFSPEGVALQSASGKVYVLDGANNVVDVFSTSGTYLSQLTGGATPAGLFRANITGLAVAQTSGDVYVSDSSNNVVDVFDSTGAYVSQITGATSPAGSLGPSGVAIDPSGDAYVVDGQNRVVDEFGPPVPVPDVTTGQATYHDATSATFTGTVNPDGIQVTDCHFDYGATTAYGQTAPCVETVGAGSSPVSVHADVAGLTPGVGYHFRLEASNANGVPSFGADRFLPAIDDQTFSGVGTTYATLNAQINPDGTDTTYHLEYGTTTAYGSSVPVPDADAGSGTIDASVSQAIEGLAAGTTYHYRVVAANAAGTVIGPDDTFTTYAPPPPQSCGNSQFRTGYSANLPDCRAYELVSPVDKNGFQVTRGELLGAFSPQDDAGGAWAQASLSGDGLAYTANGAFPGSMSSGVGDYYLATRGPGGWTTTGLLPPQGPVSSGLVNPVYFMYSADLSKGILWDATDSPPLVSGEPTSGANDGGLANLFLRDNTSGSSQLLDVAAPGTDPGPYGTKFGVGGLQFDGASADFSHIVFEVPDRLTTDAPGGGVMNIYQWVGGTVSLASEIPTPPATSCGGSGPACTPAPNGAEGGQNGPELIVPRGHLVRAVSTDGSRVFFTAGGNLYVRENGTSTVQIDAPHGAGPGGGGQFLTAAADGSRVFFLDDASAGLTTDTVGGSGMNLYSYDLNSGALADLTPAADPRVLGVIGEASTDGAYLYFVANGKLAIGATAGQANVYVWHNGTTTFIRTVHATDVYPVDSVNPSLSHQYGARVTPDGRHMAFTEDGRLFEYSADSGELHRICDCAAAFLQSPASGTQIVQPLGAFQYTRGISDDGSRVFFDTPDALVPQDTNNAEDVYEYEQDGVGSCQTAGGCLYLISDGVSPGGSQFVDASPSGNDVFISTAGQDLPQDADNLLDVYDARVGGGFPYSPPTPPCSGDACKGSPGAAPSVSLAASVTFSGPGDALAGAAPGGAAPRVKVMSRIVHGSSFFLRVAVPARGQIAISGAGIRTVRRSIAKAGTFELRVGLTAPERRALKRNHNLKLKLRIAYTPMSGAPSAAAVTMTVKR